MDIRGNESFNNLLKTLLERAPKTGLPLLSAWARIMKSLGLGTRGVSLRWSKLRPRAQSVLAEMQSHSVEGALTQQELHRFSDPLPMSLPTDKFVNEKIKECDPALAPSPVSRWTSIFQLLLGRSLSVDADFAITVHAKPGKHSLSMTAGAPMWLCADKNYSLCFLAELSTHEDGENITARVVIPFNIQSSRELFSQYFDQIQMQGGSPRAVTVHELKWTAAHTGDGRTGSNTEVFAMVQKKGSVILNLQKHAPRTRTKRDDGPKGRGATSQAQPLPPPSAPPPAQEKGGGLYIDESGEFVYEADVLEALAAELAKEEGQCEAAQEFDAWSANDERETDQDTVGIETSGRGRGYAAL